MSVQSELPVLPVELHSCQDVVGFYGSCRCAANTTFVSDQYYNPSVNHRVHDQDYSKHNPANDGIYPEHLSEAQSLMSMPYSNHHRQHRYSQGQHASRGSPVETASFECQAMYDSEPSSSPSSVVSPVDGPIPQTPSPLELTPQHMSSLDPIQHHHPHRHPRHHRYHQSPSPKGLIVDEDIRMQQLCNMHTQPNVNHHHHHLPQQPRGPKRRAAETVDAPVAGNRKERRRTQSINTAFAELRDCIPNVPADTKLSKIKTLRLATSYIAYLTDMVSRDDNMNGGCDAMVGLVDGMGNGAPMPMLRADFSLASRSLLKESIKHEVMVSIMGNVSPYLPP